MSEEKSTEEKKIEKEQKKRNPYINIMESSDEIRDISYLNRSFSEKFMRGVQKIKDMIAGRKKFFIIFAVIMCVAGYLILNNMRVLKNYELVKTSERTDVLTTSFVEMNGKLLKYSPDGVAYMDGDSVLWSAAYSMQTPIVDICEKIAVVGEQKGSQVYIYSADKGQIGYFQTLLPIQKVKVASQGVVAAVLEDGEVTWINLYDTDGNEIAKHRTSVAESGYPIDVSISPDGQKLAVSFLRTTKGVMNTKIAFYNFGSVGKAQSNNEMNSEIYENTVVPKVAYLNNTKAVAFRDNGFTIYEGKQIPEKQAEVNMDQDIISIFYDDESLGFVFQSDLSEHKYKIQLYNLKGKKTMEQYVDQKFQNIKLSSGKIILYDTDTFCIYSKQGRKIFEGKYREQITDIIKISGFRKYLVITKGSMDQVRLK